MTQRETQAITDFPLLCVAMLTGLAVALGAPRLGSAEPYRQQMMLHGAPVESKISGFAGTTYRLVADDGYAIYGLSSQERGDNPCTIWIGTESINDSAKDRGHIKTLCGGAANSRAIKAEYRDNMKHGARVFVSAVRVCTNKKENRVKGFQLRGVKIYEAPADTQAQVTVYSSLSSGYGPVIDFSEPREKYVNDPETPADFRNNCKEWQKWGECPYPGQLATGLIAHFDAGKEPRSLTGIALQCRYVSLPYAPSTR